MVPCPVALGLTLCDQVIVEEGTRNISLIGTFSRLRGDVFPFAPPSFCVVSTLTGSQGEGEIKLTVTNLETDDEVYTLTRRVTFPDRFAELHVLFRPAELVYPAPGHYIFTLLVDDEGVAHRRVRILETEGDS